MSNSETIEKQAFDAAVQTAEIAENGSKRLQQKTFTLSNGVVLRIKPFNPLIVQRAATKVPRPEPPKFLNKDTDKWEENPLDPLYNERVRDWKSAQTFSVMDAGLLLGTEIQYIPENVSRPEDDDWIESLELLGLITGDDIRPNSKARYLAWLKYYAIATDEDLGISEITLGGVGVSDEDVETTVQNFRNRSERRANSRGKTKIQS